MDEFSVPTLLNLLRSGESETNAWHNGDIAEQLVDRRLVALGQIYESQKRLKEAESNYARILHENDLWTLFARSHTVRRIPNEVLLQIFHAAEDGTVSIGSPRMVLSQVCKRWRTLARSTPDLWSRIEIRAWDDEDYFTPVPHPKVIEQSMFLSQPRKLDICLTDDMLSDTEYTQIIMALCSHAHRWRKLTILSTLDRIMDLTNILDGTHLKSLESLVCHASDALDIFPGLQLYKPLRHIDTNFNFDWLEHDKSRDAFASVDSLVCTTGSFSIFHGAIPFFTTLTSLSLLHTGTDNLHPSSATVTMEHLKSLTFSTCVAETTALNFLRAPNLENLQFMNCGHSDIFARLPFRRPQIGFHADHRNLPVSHSASNTFIDRSGCQVRKLHISLCPSQMIEAVNKLAKSLTHLTVSFVSSVGDASTIDRVYNSFALLPRLKFMTWHYPLSLPDGVALLALDNVLLSRGEAADRGEVDRMDGFAVKMDVEVEDMDSGYRSTPLAASLLKLADAGADARWTYIGGDVLEDARRYIRDMAI